MFLIKKAHLLLVLNELISKLFFTHTLLTQKGRNTKHKFVEWFRFVFSFIAIYKYTHANRCINNKKKNVNSVYLNYTIQEMQSCCGSASGTCNFSRILLFSSSFCSVFTSISAVYRNLRELLFLLARSSHEEIVFLLFVVTVADAVCIVEAIFKRNSLRVISHQPIVVWMGCMCVWVCVLCAPVFVFLWCTQVLNNIYRFDYELILRERQKHMGILYAHLYIRIQYTAHVCEYININGTDECTVMW